MRHRTPTELDSPPALAAARLLRTSYALFFYDLVAVAAAAIAALAVRFDTADPSVWLFPFLPTALLPFVVRPAVFIAFQLYRREWRHASVRELIDLLNAIVVGSVLVLAGFAMMNFFSLPGSSPFPRSFFVLEPLISLAFVAGSRLVIRATLERRAAAGDARGSRVPTIVYGAGDAGAMIGRMAATGSLPDLRVVGYLDDDRRKRGSRLLGHSVYGTLEELVLAVAETGARQLLIAMPSGPGDPVRRAVSASQDLGLVIKTVAPFRNLLTGRLQVTGIRSVGVEDLLPREPVEIDTEAIASSINGASVVVTGGGGSIGSELVRQILTLGPRVLTIVDNHEWTLWSAERDVAARRQEAEGAHVVAALADVRSASALDAVLRRAKPDIVFHAAALKHVPYVEMFPAEGVLTNVIGTRNVLRTCEELSVDRFVLISTDKAVEPVSVMGATKRLAEQLTVAAGRRTGRAYAAVRFGNVLGSSGSVIPLLQRQLDDGLPLTITQPDATRYFMTIAEAVSLILEAGVNPRPGDVYVLDMGEPVRIIDLARDLVRLNGLDPDAVRFAVTGLRPGERLHEKLFYDDEQADQTEHSGILRASRRDVNLAAAELDSFVEHLEEIAWSHDDGAIRELLAQSHNITGMTANAASQAMDVPLDADRRRLPEGAAIGRAH